MNDGRRVNHGLSCKLLLFSARVQILMFQLLVLGFNRLSLIVFVCLFVVLLDTVFHVIMHLVLHLVPSLLSFVSPSQKWIKNKKQMHCLAAAVQSVVAWDQTQRCLSTYKSIHK